jgi:hypothetical protein
MYAMSFMYLRKTTEALMNVNERTERTKSERGVDFKV